MLLLLDCGWRRSIDPSFDSVKVESTRPRLVSLCERPALMDELCYFSVNAWPFKTPTAPGTPSRPVASVWPQSPHQRPNLPSSRASSPDILINVKIMVRNYSRRSVFFFLSFFSLSFFRSFFFFTSQQLDVVISRNL